MSKRTASSFLLVGLVCGFPGWAEARPSERSSEALSEVRGDRDSDGAIAWAVGAFASLLGLDGERGREAREGSAGPRSLWGAEEGGGHHDPHG